MTPKNGYSQLDKLNVNTLAIGGTDVSTTAAEANELHGAGAVKADFEKLHGISASAEEINLLSGAGAVLASGTQAAHIADAAAAAGAAPDKAEFDAVATKLNAVLAALEAFSIAAAE